MRPKILTEEESHRRALQRTADWKTKNRTKYLESQSKTYFKRRYGEDWEKKYQVRKGLLKV